MINSDIFIKIFEYLSGDNIFKLSLINYEWHNHVLYYCKYIYNYYAIKDEFNWINFKSYFECKYCYKIDIDMLNHTWVNDNIYLCCDCIECLEYCYKCNDIGINNKSWKQVTDRRLALDEQYEKRDYLVRYIYNPDDCECLEYGDCIKCTRTILYCSDCSRGKNIQSYIANCIICNTNIISKNGNMSYKICCKCEYSYNFPPWTDNHTTLLSYNKRKQKLNDIQVLELYEDIYNPF